MLGSIPLSLKRKHLGLHRECISTEKKVSYLCIDAGQLRKMQKSASSLIELEGNSNN